MLHCAEVDQAGDGVAVEQHVVVPDVADADLEWQRHVGEWGEAGDGEGDDARQLGDKLAGEWGELGPDVVGDCAGERRDAAGLQFAEASEAGVIAGAGPGRAAGWRLREVGDRNVEFGECVHGGAEFFDARRLFVVGSAREPGRRVPRGVRRGGRTSRRRSLQSARAESSCHGAAACRSTAWMNCSRSGVGCSIGQHRSTSVPRGATSRQKRAPLRPPAEPERLDRRRLTIWRVRSQDFGDFFHANSTANSLGIARPETGSNWTSAATWRILIGYSGQTFPTSRNVENGVYLGGWSSHLSRRCPAPRSSPPIVTPSPQGSYHASSSPLGHFGARALGLCLAIFAALPAGAAAEDLEESLRPALAEVQAAEAAKGEAATAEEKPAEASEDASRSGSEDGTPPRPLSRKRQLRPRRRNPNQSIRPMRTCSRTPRRSPG